MARHMVRRHIPAVPIIHGNLAAVAPVAQFTRLMASGTSDPFDSQAGAPRVVAVYRPVNQVWLGPDHVGLPASMAELGIALGPGPNVMIHICRPAVGLFRHVAMGW